MGQLLVGYNARSASQRACERNHVFVISHFDYEHLTTEIILGGFPEKATPPPAPPE